MNLFAPILNLLFPSRCPICSHPSNEHSHNPICAACWSDIVPYHGPKCSICGMPTKSQYTGTCGDCLHTAPPFSKIMYYGIYEGTLRESIHLLKFGGIKRLAQPLSKLLLSLPASQCDAILPVPLHRNKLREREFNQTALLGKHLSMALKRPLLLHSFQKVRETKLQTEVSGRERYTNLRKAYAASDDVRGKNILLVDDVITTGATVRECAATLKRAGARQVEVIALAHSMPRL